MYKILEKRALNSTVIMMNIEAPLVARHAEPGQFIILRVDEEGERIPLTIADFDRELGTVKIILLPFTLKQSGAVADNTYPSAAVTSICVPAINKP
jgi:ferredoxin--NADP+ reductase